MSLRNDFYIKLYVNDVVSDEKLNECSAKSNGVYFRLICFLHRQKEYGCFTLTTKSEKIENVIHDFANKLVKHMPFNIDEINEGINELYKNDVIQIDGQKISQKRMVEDSLLSEKRSKAGKNGLITRHEKINGLDVTKQLDKNKQFVKALFDELTESDQWMLSTANALDLPFGLVQNNQWTMKKLHSFLKIELVKYPNLRDKDEIVMHFISWALIRVKDDPKVNKHRLVNNK